MMTRAFSPVTARLLSLFPALLAVGCATFPPQEEQPRALPEEQPLLRQGEALHAPLPLPSSFVVEGRFAARHEQQGVSGRFVWQANADSETWHWLTPAGTPLAQLTVTPAAARLRTAEGQTFSAEQPEALAAAFLPGDVPPWPMWRAALWGSPPADAVPTRQGEAIAWHAAGWHWSLTFDGDGRWPRRVEVRRGETALTVVIESREGP